MLSIVVNVKNGERYLARCLSSLNRFNDVVLLDNFSTDNTLEIAKSYPNVRVFQSEFLGMGKVRNLAASYAKNDWVLFVDCDEVLETKLVDILLVYPFTRGNLYCIYRKNYYDGKLIESSSWGNDWIKRLYNRNDTQLVENEVHDSFVDRLPLVKINGGSMFHFPYEKVSQLIDKMQFYSNLYAKQHYKKRKLPLWMIPFRAFFTFFKCYFLKRGFLAGYEGLIISVYNSVGVFSKYIKLYELERKSKFALAIKLDDMSQLSDLKQLLINQSQLSELVILLVNKNKINYNSKDIRLMEIGFISCCNVVHYTDDVEDALNQEIRIMPNISTIAYCTRVEDFKDAEFVAKIRFNVYSETQMSNVVFVTK